MQTHKKDRKWVIEKVQGKKPQRSGEELDGAD